MLLESILKVNLSPSFKRLSLHIVLNTLIGNPFVNNEKHRDEIRLVHLGISTHIRKSVLNLKASKKINKTDLIKYKLSFDRKINKTNMHIFFVGNEEG